MLNVSEAYPLLVYDSLLASLLLPLDSELIFATMIAFGGYNVITTGALAFVASMIGAAVNFACGNMLFRFRSHFNVEQKAESNLLRISTLANKYGFWLLLFTSHHIFGGILCVVAGLLNIRIKAFIAMVVLGKISYYSWYIMNETGVSVGT